jgi:F0F1-type ATP synthase assembly protein I
MLDTFATVSLALWALGVVVSSSVGGLVDLLPVLAILLILMTVSRDRRT